MKNAPYNQAVSHVLQAVSSLSEFVGNDPMAGDSPNEPDELYDAVGLQHVLDHFLIRELHIDTLTDENRKDLKVYLESFPGAGPKERVRKIIAYEEQLDSNTLRAGPLSKRPIASKAVSSPLQE